MGYDKAGGDTAAAPDEGGPSPEDGRPSELDGSEPGTFGESAYYPPPAQPEAGGGVTSEASDSRLAAAMNPTEPQPSSPEQTTSTAGPPSNWWEQPVPSAAVPVVHSPIEPEATMGEGEDASEETGVSFWRWLWEAAVLVALAFVIAFVIKVFVVQPFYIPSGSMEPTLLPGDRVLVNKFIYRMRQPEPGDVVVFEAPRDAEKRDFIKRIVAVEGQTVEVKDGKVYVDGKLRAESYLASTQDHSSFGPVTLSDNTVFVMGDNRTNSSDSRVFGPFDRDRILGEAFVVYWPVPRVRSL